MRALEPSRLKPKASVVKASPAQLLISERTDASKPVASSDETTQASRANRTALNNAQPKRAASSAARLCRTGLPVTSRAVSIETRPYWFW